METIVVEWYCIETKKINKSELKAFGLKEAIDMIRSANSYKIICLSSEYKDKQKLIESVLKLNGELIEKP